MSHKKHKITTFRQYCEHVLREEVFGQVRFQNKRMRRIVYDSYIDNLDAMIGYVVSNNLDMRQYLTQIKTILLNSKNVRKRTR